MPANLPPQYVEAEKRYRAAKGPEEKVEALQAMLAAMPHHKGTDKLHGELRRKIAKLSQEAEKKTATARRAGFFIRKEGAGQVVLVGLANSGKSQLLAALTGASPEIAPYPFTTQVPALGMADFEDIQLQVVDTPPIDHRSIRSLLSNTLRTTDLIVIVVDLAGEPVQQTETVLGCLADIRVVSHQAEDTDPGLSKRRMLIVGNKYDLPGAGHNYATLLKQYGAAFPVLSASHLDEQGLQILKHSIFHSLDIVRVYTKAPRDKADRTAPIILPRASTVQDAAEELHRDFAARLKYAVIWGSGKFDAQKASRTHQLQDGDVIEFHT
ncbi:MAG: GTPase [Chloroflexota bacterium]